MANQQKEEGDGMEALVALNPADLLFCGEAFRLGSLLDAFSESLMTKRTESSGGLVVTSYGETADFSSPVLMSNTSFGDGYTLSPFTQVGPPLIPAFRMSSESLMTKRTESSGGRVVPSYGETADSSSPVLMSNTSFGDSYTLSPFTQVGPPLIPDFRMSPLTFPQQVFVFPTSNGTQTFCISPTHRPSLFKMSTPETPYGRLLNENPSPNTRKVWKHALDNRVRLTPNKEDSPSVSPQSTTESNILYTMGMNFFERIRLQLRPTSDEEIQKSAISFVDPVLPQLLDDDSFFSPTIDFALEQEAFPSPLSTPLSVTSVPPCKSRRNKTVRNLVRVMFSGMGDEDRDGWKGIIEKLGGSTIDGEHYDASCTHLVVAELSSSNLVISCIAAGKWILHPGWIAKSDKVKHFVEEQKFEWGSATSNDSISPKEMKVAAAAYYWCTSRNRKLSGGPFQGISAILRLQKGYDALQVLIEAGGGKVIACDTGLALDKQETNICVFSMYTLRYKIKEDLSHYAMRGIYCVGYSYFKDLILGLGRKMDWAECVVPEFLPFLNSIPSPQS